jgi:hypothetical protein
MKIIVIALIMLTASCTNNKSGSLVKDAEGNIYKLRPAPANESYFLDRVDTVELNKIRK